MHNYEKFSNQLKEQYPYILELHAHTSPASGCSQVPPEELVTAFAEAGYDGISITNHFFPDGGPDSKQRIIDAFIKDLELARETGEKLGVKIYQGAELRFPNVSDNDYLFFGYDYSMLPEIYDYMFTDLKTFVRDFKSEDMLIIQAHPFRDDMKLMPPDLLDALEAFNVHPNHNGRVAVAAKYAREHGKVMTIGTDYHHRGHHGISATRTSILPENTNELIKIIKNNDFIIDIGGKLII